MPLASGIHYFLPTLPLYVFAAEAPGPTAIIQAGIHGDEIAGVHAVQELLEEDFRPHRGRLIFVPVMNPPAYRARTRCAPEGLDLNRCFPGNANADAYELRLARKFMDLVEDEKPALVATLHESQKRYDPEVQPSFGQTLVYGVKPMPAIIARTIERLNQIYIEPQDHWAPHYYPVATSSTEVIVEKTSCIGICVETWMGFPEARRIAMQRTVIELLLTDLGIRERSE